VTEGGWRDAEALGGRAEAQVVRYGNERGQVGKIGTAHF
jgi:hypothetical protein